jgi:branched-chain amino acid transport system substrate-binding protein
MEMQLGRPLCRLALLAPWLILGCGGSDAPSGPPIRVGATMSETGAYATQGIPARNGYRLCEAEVNAAGGLLGRPVSFLILDDASRGEQAAALYEALIQEEGVDLILGPYGSTLTEAVAPVTERHNRVHISPLAATSSIWEQGRRNLFMVLPPAERFLDGLLELGAQEGYRRVGILEEDALFPRAAGSGAEARAGALGLQVVLRARYPSGTTDFAPLLRQVEAEGVEVLALAASALDDFVKITEAMQALGVQVALLGTTGAVREYAEALGAGAEGVLGLSAWEATLPYAGAQDFARAYEDRFGVEPSFHAAGAYGSCQLLMEAVRLRGSLDQEALRTTLLGLETTTVFGPFAVDSTGYQTANGGVFVQWQDGRKVVVFPEAVAQGPLRRPGALPMPLP